MNTEAGTVHRFVPASDEAPAPALDPSHAEAIKRWTREALRLADEDVVTVAEVACVDAGCPLVETVVAVEMYTSARSAAACPR